MRWFISRPQSAPQQVVENVQSVVLAEDDLPNIAAASREASTLVYSVSNELPMLGFIHALSVIDMVDGAVKLGVDNLHARISLSAVVRDYLPTSIKTYVAAKRAGHDAPDDLVEQMSSLSSAVSDVLDSIRRNNSGAMEAQSIFLRNKFSGSDLL